ncbi:conserved Plasmodium protein, unknown function [Plasmodium gallinaceum]|uniref:Signal recognition particle subunit SRP72 n=1 Tax=Plasmodium gallinaceum TaxID=5849 RepID=A0A1J1GYP2_PLAGA|nr:conserved Plasmodium protein, unknown function [Plasmodium gallinaceum]CRG96416.1 conserved Plasmodium protein, unknown function [Plasmodium gallinaceum]
MDEIQIRSKEIPLEEIKYNFEKKNYTDVIFLTNNIFINENCNEFALKTRFYCFMELKDYTRIIHEIIYCLIKIKDKEKTFKNIFQENYTKIRDKNVLFELFYSMYKLGKYKKLNGCLKFLLENENKYDDFINVLLAQVNFKLRKFETSINTYELLLNDKGKQAIATINLYSSYFSMYIELMYEYNFLKIPKNKLSEVVEFKNLEILREKIKKITKNFKYEENDNFELLFNYAIFFTIEKNYSEAVKYLDLLENICRSLLIDDTNNSKNLCSTDIAEINSKRILIQLERAYIYSKTNRIKESLIIYENILNSYDENINNIIILLAYNNYLAIMHNDINKNIDKKSNDIIFNINNDKLNQIKSFIYMNKDIHSEVNEISNSIISFNECLLCLNADLKDDFKIKLSNFSLRFKNSILLDILKIMTFKNENYMKCKYYILNIIDRMQSTENKIKFINAYVYLCYEKRSYKEIVKIYLKYEDIFQNNVNDYSIFFSNMFYICICIKYTENFKLLNSGNTNNLNLVIDLFQKYKENIKKNINIVNYETLFLVSKYLIYHNKSDLLIDIFDYLSNEVKNNFNFFSCYTYVSTYINLSNAYKYEDKLKKTVLGETYLIDVDELENKSITFDLTINNEIISASVEKNKRKRKRKKKKNVDSNNYNHDPDKWLPKHEKPGYKKFKKKKKKSEITRAKIVIVEENKNQINQSKLQKLKKRRKK